VSRPTAVTSILVIGLLAVSGFASAALAQDASPSPEASSPPDGLAALCEANAPDEASMATCIDIVGTVLASSSESVRLATVPTADEFYAGMTELLPPRASVKAGKLKGVSRYADQVRAYLLSVVPDPCYDNMYASAWGVATALQQWRDKALKQPEKLLFNTFSQFVESPQAISCAEPMAGE
jgi:hypothetical protein